MTQLLGKSSIALLAGSDPLGALSNFVFFKVINDFLRNEIDVVQWKLLTGSAAVVGFAGVVVLTVWIMFQGYRIVTGQSQQPMMALVGDSLKAALILMVATTAAYSSSSVYWTVTDGMTTAISSYVTDGSSSPFDSIDKNLATMEASLALIDALDTGGSTGAEAAKDRDRWFTGVGIAGPSVIAGAMLLLNKIALALFVGFGPIFIMCLLFNSTKQLFSKWLLYGIGTVFSLAVLSVMVTIAMKMMTAVTAAFAAKYAAATIGDMGSSDGISSMALQQGGLGLLLSTLIVMAPPMAAAFFQGTLGNFASYSSFGTIGGGGGYAARQQAMAQGRVPAPHTPPPSNDSTQQVGQNANGVRTYGNFGADAGSLPDPNAIKKKD
ncbi:MAG: type IV secretion system protein [Luteibacter sp.]